MISLIHSKSISCCNPVRGYSPYPFNFFFARVYTNFTKGGVPGVWNEFNSVLSFNWIDLSMVVIACHLAWSMPCSHTNYALSAWQQGQDWKKAWEYWCSCTPHSQKQLAQWAVATTFIVWWQNVMCTYNYENTVRRNYLTKTLRTWRYFYDVNFTNNSTNCCHWRKFVK